MVRRDGSVFLAEVRVMRLPDGRCQGLLRDITERRRLEAEQRRRAEEIRALVENTPDIIARVDRQLRHCYVNPALEGATGMSADDFIGKTDRELGFLSAHVDAWEDAYRQVFATGREHELSFAYPTARGERHYSARFVPEFDSIGAVDTVLVVARDVSAEKLAEAERRRAERELRQYANRLAEAQEAERRRIAHELHDQVGQQLTGVTLLLEALARDPSAAPVAAELAEAQAAVSSLLAEVRDLSLRLRPSMLDDLGLLPALLWLVDSYSAQTGIEVSIQHSGLDNRLRPEVETAVYRNVQEALTNVARHSGATRAAVHVVATGGHTQMRVADEGRGFDPSDQAQATSSGLIGMRQRAESAGGTLRVVSGKNKGTVVTAHFPVRAED